MDKRLNCGRGRSNLWRRKKRGRGKIGGGEKHRNTQLTT